MKIKQSNKKTFKKTDLVLNTSGGIFGRRLKYIPTPEFIINNWESL